jgi:hypothetical protein
MKYCQQCGAEQIVKGNYCASCGYSLILEDDLSVLDNPARPLKSKGNSSFLTTLCILTIIGSVIGIFRGILYQFFASIPDAGNAEYFRGILYFIANFGTLVGAIFLLNGKINGLYVYSVFQVAYLLTVIWATSVYIGGDFTDMLAVTLGAIFFLPSLAFLIMYWTEPVRGALD